MALRLVEKALAGGSRLLLVAPPPLLDELDRALWTDKPDSFLPHGRAGTEWDAEQPCLLAAEPVPANGARLLMLVDHGVPAALEHFDRVLNLFDHGSEAHARARADWKALGARAGVDRTYWQQTEAGRWESRA